MRQINNILKYIGYLTLSTAIGYIGAMGGVEHDFIMDFSSNLIPLLLTIATCYMTISAIILNELSRLGQENHLNINSVLISMKHDFIIQIIIIAIAFIFFTIIETLYNVIAEEYFTYLEIISNTITVFSFGYFLLFIYDSINGLYKLISNKNSKNFEDE